MWIGILSCLPQVDSILLPQVQGKLMESESPDTKKGWNNKNNEGKIFWSKKARFECVKIVLLDQESLKKSFPFWQGYAKVAVLGRDVVYVKLEELLEKNLAVWVASDLDFFCVIAMLSFMESDILALGIRSSEIISFSLVCVYEQTLAPNEMVTRFLQLTS